MRAVGLVAGLSGMFALSSSVAGAGPLDPVPTPFVARGLLMGKGQAYAAFAVSGSTVPISDSTLDTSVSVGVGLTDRISLDGSLGTLTLAPRVLFRSPNVGLWVGIVDTPRFELDATARVTFGIGQSQAISGVEPGAVGIFRFGKALRVDTAVYVPVSPGDTTTVGTRFPVSVGVQLGRYFHVALSSGVTIEDLRKASSSFVLPLGLSIGVSAAFPGGGGMGLTPSVSWPRLIDTGRTDRCAPIATVIGATLSVATP